MAFTACYGQLDQAESSKSLLVAPGHWFRKPCSLALLRCMEPRNRRVDLARLAVLRYTLCSHLRRRVAVSGSSGTEVRVFRLRYRGALDVAWSRNAARRHSAGLRPLDDIGDGLPPVAVSEVTRVPKRRGDAKRDGSARGGKGDSRLFGAGKLEPLCQHADAAAASLRTHSLA